MLPHYRRPEIKPDDINLKLRVMAEIKIYGTLSNDTGEPIAKADQVIDPATGKMVSELLAEGTGGTTDMQEITAEEIDTLIAEVLGNKSE